MSSGHLVAQLGDDVRDVVRVAPGDGHPGGSGDSLLAVEHFRLRLVDGDRAAPNAGTRVGKAYRLQEALDGPVFAPFAVKRQKGHVEAAVDERLQVGSLGRVELRDLVTRLLQRLLRALGRLQRNRPLPA